MAEDHLDLAGEFTAADDTAWRAAVEKALGSRPFDKVMQSASYDGVPLHALYTKDSARIEPQPKGREGAWHIVAPHANPDAQITNAAILEDLERGATAVVLRLAAGGIPGIRPSDLPAALKGVYLNMAQLDLLPGEGYEAACKAALELFEDADGEPSDVKASLGVDPLGTIAVTGRLHAPLEDALEAAVGIATDVAARFENVTTFTADGSLFHAAGATEAQELGTALSTGLAYLRAMETAGMSVEEAFGQIRFTLAADADLFLTIAKFRAVRRLWAKVAEACGVGDIKMDVAAASALRMYSVRDPWVNILRGTAACFAAGVGGADSICIQPHDTMLGLSTPFARRIARNIQIILQEESNLSRVADPAGGAYAVESVTADLADKAWSYMQKLEKAGGIAAALAGGIVQADLADTWSRRLSNLSNRKEAVTGVSEFPDIHEKPVAPLAAWPTPDTPTEEAGVTVEPLPMRRNAEAFEQLRDRGDAMKAKTGKRPAIFLANLGPVAAHTARATFAKNFFEAGGIEALPSSGFSDAGELAAAFEASGASVAVICGRDEDYDDLGLEAATALKDKGCGHIHLAGRPADAEPFTHAGVDGFIYMGCDVIDTLEHTYNVMGGEK